MDRMSDKMAFDAALQELLRAPVHVQRALLQQVFETEGISGIGFDSNVLFVMQPNWKQRDKFAYDAQPQLVTTPQSGIPSFLTTFLDPELLRILTAKNAAAEILGEVRKGSFVDVTAVFPVVEHTGEVSSYGDFSQAGRSGANTNFPQRENYLYQTIIEYGELEMERAGLAKIGWAAELKQSAIVTLNKFQNFSYFFGIAGLQNYGLLNDPSLNPGIAPALKAAGGLTWFVGNSPNATGLEVYNDIVSLVVQLIAQSGGNVNAESEMVLAMSPHSAGALNFTNTFNVNVKTLLATNYPNLKVIPAIQYGAQSTQNPQGSAAGELVQLIATKPEGQETGYAAFSEKLRAGPIIRDLSSYKQKMTQGTWGAVIRQPFAIAEMIGV
jgi:hypothetical protein